MNEQLCRFPLKYTLEDIFGLLPQRMTQNWQRAAKLNFGVRYSNFRSAKARLMNDGRVVFSDGAFRPQKMVKESFGEGVGCRAKVSRFGGLGGGIPGFNSPNSF